MPRRVRRRHGVRQDADHGVVHEHGLRRRRLLLWLRLRGVRIAAAAAGIHARTAAAAAAGIHATAAATAQWTRSAKPHWLGRRIRGR